MPKRFAYDTETTSLKISKMQIVGMSFYSGTGKPAYIQFNFTDKVENKIKDGRKTVVELVDYKHDKGIDFEDARPYLEQILEGAEPPKYLGIELAICSDRFGTFEYLFEVRSCVLKVNPFVVFVVHKFHHSFSPVLDLVFYFVRKIELDVCRFSVPE
jgi:hypothetical protein